MAKDTNNFGGWLLRWRKAENLTQPQLAEIVGVSKQHISNLERSEKSSYTGKAIKPSIELVDKLAKALGRPITEARNHAGYGLKDGSTKNEQHLVEETPVVNEILGYIRELPLRTQLDLLAMVRALHKERSSQQEFEEGERIVIKAAAKAPIPRGNTN